MQHISQYESNRIEEFRVPNSATHWTKAVANEQNISHPHAPPVQRPSKAHEQAKSLNKFQAPKKSFSHTLLRGLAYCRSPVVAARRVPPTLFLMKTRME